MFFLDFDMFFKKAMATALIVQILKKIDIDVANIHGSHNIKLLKKMQKIKKYRSKNGPFWSYLLVTCWDDSIASSRSIVGDQLTDVACCLSPGAIHLSAWVMHGFNSIFELGNSSARFYFTTQIVPVSGYPYRVAVFPNVQL